MQELQFSYRMRLDFSEPAAKHQFTLRMFPKTDARQQIMECEVKLEPECNLSKGEDTFGNRYLYGEISQEHTCFSVEVFGRAAVDRKDVFLWREDEINRYRYPSRYTKTGEKLRTYFAKVKKESGKTGYAFAKDLMDQLYRDIQYRQGVTTISTTAEEALIQKQGVCQDYAHIMIALCRLEGIAARYVVGMMLGEGYSHAWVEVCTDGVWHGIDPTNRRLVDENYIKISHGRDYQDCIVNRGVFLGGGIQTQTVKVEVKQIERGA